MKTKKPKKTRTPRTGRPLVGQQPRLRLFAQVAATTHLSLSGWAQEAKDPRVRVGQVLDRLTAHGHATAFSPAQRLAEDTKAEERQEGRTLPIARTNPHD